MTALRHAPRALAVLAAATVLAACGSGTHNDADVAFAQQMVPHHEQAVEMSDLALEPDRGASPEVRELAEQIGSAQHDEIDLMNGWLEEWGESADTGHGDHGDGHGDHGGGGEDHAMEGMLTDEQMADLAAATGTQFDELWLTFMIEHHEGAVEMAETAVADGKDADVQALAEQVVEVQRSEIAQMQALLG